ncbi:hypothetical protein MMC10_001928 [Thelotrema lepadinum]|nr:hypothetical protein [Thelotrema lepadinum]
MPLVNRLRARNVHIYDFKERSNVLGGTFLAQQITNSKFYALLDMFIVSSGDLPAYFLQTEDGIKIERNSDFFEPGDYYLDVAGVQITDEAPLIRTVSTVTGTRLEAFTDAVCSRDDQCIISGRRVVTYNNVSFYTGFGAAHIFPLAYESHWNSHDYSRWITQVPENGRGSIDSVQNGLLLSSEAKDMFETYSLSINPDIFTCFFPAAARFAGNIVPQSFLDNPLRTPDQLLRWHFRQAVLTNMKGVGEPVFEHQFDSGANIMGDIRNGPKAAERMEFEIFSRLAVHTEVV